MSGDNNLQRADMQIHVASPHRSLDSDGGPNQKQGCCSGAVQSPESSSDFEPVDPPPVAMAPKFSNIVETETALKQQQQQQQKNRTQRVSRKPKPPQPAVASKPRPVPQMPDMNSDINCLNSLNYLSTHPDAIRQSSVACSSCGRSVRLGGEDWYTEVYDGTVRCRQCSFCARCGIDGIVYCRQLVSIGGYVLCYRCIQHYGHNPYDQPMPTLLPVIDNEKRQLKNVTLKRSTSAAEQKPVMQQSSEEFESHNSCESDRNPGNRGQSRRSPECRTLQRYPKLVKRVPELDPTLNHIGYYAATRPEFERMVCPTCKVTAKGKDAYVVPSISLVYHRKCFFCLGCKSLLSTGVKNASEHFVFCSCTSPQLWCTKDACTRKRMEHHAKYKCFLEPIHPGGREQNDTRILFVENFKDKDSKDEKTMKLADDSATAENPNLIADLKLYETIVTSDSNAASGLKVRQQLELLKSSGTPGKDSRLSSPGSATLSLTPSITSVSSAFSTAVGCGAGLFGAGRDRKRWRPPSKNL